jgi:uncharacterized membrane protein
MDAAREKNIITTLYGCVIGATILGFMPHLAIQGFSMVLFLGCLIAGYVYKGKAATDGLLYNHMTYFIGTIWYFSIFLAIGTIIASFWIHFQGDFSSIAQMMQKFGSGVPFDESFMRSLFMQYINDNKMLLITAMSVCIGPSFIYLIYRVTHGYSRANKAYRIANPDAWL